MFGGILFFVISFAIVSESLDYMTVVRPGNGIYPFMQYLPNLNEINVTKKFPLLLYMHGVKEKGDGSDDQIDVLKHQGPERWAEVKGEDMCCIHPTNEEKYCFVVVAPQCPTNDFGFSGVKILELIEWVLEKNENINPERVYVTGFSMGGRGTWSSLTADVNNSIITAASPQADNGAGNVCGSGEWETPIWGFYGQNDPYISPDGATTIFNNINSCGVRSDIAKLTIYPDREHNCWQYAYETDHTHHNPNLYEWFLLHGEDSEDINNEKEKDDKDKSKKKKADPKKVAVVVPLVSALGGAFCMITLLIGVGLVFFCSFYRKKKGDVVREKFLDE